MITIKQSLNKAFLNKPISETDVCSFKESLCKLIGDINIDESEENNKNDVRDFLKNTIGSQYYINTLGNDDLVIYHDGQYSDVGVILEFKKPSNKSEFSTKDNLNRKSLQQLVFYYIQERVERKNSNIVNLIMTNCYKWFVFDVSVFAKCFDNKELRSSYEKWKNRQQNKLQDSTTDWFYHNIASVWIDKNIEFLNNSYTYFDLKEVSRIKDDKKLIPWIKFFTPYHLLKKPFANDSNSLNKDFYNELLYIIGLEEVKEKQKRIIVRPPKGLRQLASFIELSIEAIASTEKDKENEVIFNHALEAVLTWINRTLFIKLLEGQLAGYKKDSNYTILNSSRITDFDKYSQLFFKVLAVEPSMRMANIKKEFVDIPYLNSSLFQITEIERMTVEISHLQNKQYLPIYSKSVLKNEKGKRLTGKLETLDYLFKFLSAYDFGSVDSSSIRKDSKDLINSSVLGLIYEKINGYKDGAFFTPGFVTMYMCRESIRKSVLYRLNKHFGWSCERFDDLKDEINNSNYVEVDSVICSTTICDPAVGSGHFLVSALNELIAIKSELKLLMRNSNERLTGYYAYVENDELIVMDKLGEIFEYNPNDMFSQEVQETLFNEKRRIIENCLFGVDLNPNSVNICRLRLWIELLKCAYYKQDGGLETLPNIDINIKYGNSLIHKYPVKIGDALLNQVDGRSNFGKQVAEYKIVVANYKRTNNKKEKEYITNQLAQIKRGVFQNVQLNIFEDVSGNNIYKNSMEWMFEFPEILSNNGSFLGFDVVIGNPPYGVSIKDGYRKIVSKLIDKVPDYEIYYYFIEIAKKILKENGILSYIIPNTYLFNTFAEKYRLKLLKEWNMCEILDCSKFSIFENATVLNTINTWQKGLADNIGYRNTADINKFADLVGREKLYIDSNSLIEMNKNWGLAFSLGNETVALVNKIRNNKQPLDTLFSISQGYIPYRKSDLVKLYGQDEGEKIVNERLWHSKIKKGSDYIQEIYGKDITKYNHRATGVYVKYGKHVASYVDPIFFTHQRLLIREITNPNIIASIVEDSFINDPQIISVINTNSRICNNHSLLILWAVFNSKLATFYHFNSSPKATKGAFPKILVRDIKQFPLPEITSEEQVRIEELVCQILDKKRENPQADTIALEAEIDQMVYALYNLTPEEINLIENK